MEKLHKFKHPEMLEQRAEDQFNFTEIFDMQVSPSAYYQKMLQGEDFGKWELNFEQGYADGCALFHSIFGRNPGKVNLKTFWNDFDNENRARLRQSYRDAHTGSQISLDIRISEQRDQHPVWIRIWGQATMKRENEIVMLQGFLRIVTDCYIHEYLASEMLSFANHEIRASLAALKLYVQQSQRSVAKAKIADANILLAKADEKIDAITKLTETFLDSTVLTAGNLKLSADEFNITQLLHEVAIEFRVLNPGYYFLVIAPGLVGIKADRLKLRQALANLVNNAVKYSPEGSTVTLFCEVHIDGIRVKVRDEGIGVSENEADKIFRKFHRTADSRASKIGGYGIGLFLFRKIIEKHEGTVGVISRQERGSEFYFKLPTSRFSALC